VEFSAVRVLKLWGAALVAAALACLLEYALHMATHPVFRGLAILTVYGAAYLLFTHLLGVSGALSSIFARLGLKRS
jgi:hypothetical protein